MNNLRSILYSMSKCACAKIWKISELLIFDNYTLILSSTE